MKKLLFLIVLIIGTSVFAEGFLKTQGKNIVNEQGENVLLRGIGLGGWMLQEGYMMRTEGFANPQWEIREKIVELIGEEDTDAYFDAWLANFVRKVDVDSIAAWGFNSIRLPMHYKLFTLPIEDEPGAGGNTWLDKGFEMTDALLSWCKANNLYLILDLHGAPGGQGANAAISDYDPSKPSLWESKENRDKTVALWKKLAERYADEPWIGGYDLINETNWTLPGNTALRQLYIEITDSIRTVDTKHIIFIEGNSYANDFTGLTPPWDDNMVYSFHKYWNNTDQSSLGFVLPIRDTYNVPLWCGESGENSNVWNTETIRTLENNNIGWAWWPLKKVEELDGPMDIIKTDGYQTLLDYWSGNGSKPTQSFAKNVMMELAENSKLENIVFRKGYIDAMIRQVQTMATKPFKKHVTDEIIYASDYDLGTQGYAYYDNDYGYFGGDFTAWNSGWSYRNDGVDIERCEDDDLTNGYNLGWTRDDEWVNYTLTIPATGTYDLILRVATPESGGKMHFELDNRPVTGIIDIPSTGGWQNWQDVFIDDIVLEEGARTLKLYIDKQEFNVSFFIFYDLGPLSSVGFNGLYAKLSEDGKQVIASLNKKIESSLPASPGGFSIKVNGADRAIESYSIDATGYQILFDIEGKIFFEDEATVSYSGNAVSAVDGSKLNAFSNIFVKNTQESRSSIPGKIEAEDFDVNVGFGLENTSDTGGGQNLGFANIGDYVEYLVTVPQGGTYAINYRVASAHNGGDVKTELVNDDGSTLLLHNASFPGTGGWQTWTTVSKNAEIPEGRFTLRITVTSTKEFNLNWFSFDFVTSLEDNNIIATEFQLLQNYPNPFNPTTTIEYYLPQSGFTTLDIFNAAGQRVERFVNKKQKAGSHSFTFNAGNLSSGLYFYKIKSGAYSAIRKMLLIK